MKKILCLGLILALSVFLVACGEEKTELEMLEEKVTYIESMQYIGENDNFRVEFTHVRGELNDDTTVKDEGKGGRYIVRLKPKSLDALPESYNVTMQCKDNKVDFSMLKDILGMSYSASLDENMMTFVPMEILIHGGENDVHIEFYNALKDAKIDAKNVLSTAYNAVKEDIAQYFENNKFDGKVIIKLINNHKKPSSPYYFYVSFVKDDENFVACLIDPMSGEVLSKKVK